MNDRELRRLDMALLIVFSEAMRHRKLTVVAGRLGQTQSSISHAIGRLREIFDDPLFMRRPDGVVPTERATMLLPQVEAILDLARAALDRSPAFDAASTQETVRIAAQDYHCAVFAAPLIKVCAAQAPGLRLSFRALAREAALAALAAGEIDLAIGFLPRLDARFTGTSLVEQGYAVVARAGHPRIDRPPLTLDAYLAERHLLVSQTGNARGIVDGLLLQKGKTRDVVATVPYYLPALATVAATDLIATVPRLLAETHGPAYELAVFDPPLTIRRFAISAVRHKRQDGSALIAWVTARLVETFSGTA